MVDPKYFQELLVKPNLSESKSPQPHTASRGSTDFHYICYLKKYFSIFNMHPITHGSC